MTDNAITVKQLNLYVKSIIEGDRRLAFISVEGEISNFKNHYSSGHWYFTIKDNDASIRCVMFKSSALRVAFKPQDGMRVIVSGKVSLYEKDGQYQFYAQNMVPFGQGDLALAFKLCKEKLEKEGLFDESTKRALNKNPSRIAVITSDTGAAIHDICSTLRQRMPSCEIVVCPVTVQGLSAPKTIINTLERVYALNGIDTIIIGRGGGSAEDLAPFNDEMLARKIYESPVPVISAVGHETDFTICDFVADVRAATPTAAAMLASGDSYEILQSVNQYKNRLISFIKIKIDNYQYRLSSLVSSKMLKNPSEIIDRKLQTVDLFYDKLCGSINSIVTEKENIFSKNVSKLDALSPLKTITRGFSYTMKNGKPIASVKEIDVGDSISVRLTDGTVNCEVKEKNDA